MNDKRRLTLQCHYDQRTYTHLVPLDYKAKIIVECPYCHHKGTVDLAPYRKPYRDIERGGRDGAALGEHFVFPDAIPTKPVEA